VFGVDAGDDAGVGLGFGFGFGVAGLGVTAGFGVGAVAAGGVGGFLATSDFLPSRLPAPRPFFPARNGRRKLAEARGSPSQAALSPAAARDLVHRTVHERAVADGEAREDVVVVRGAPHVGMARQ